MYKLRPYQQEAVDLTISHFKRTKDPAVITLPTGAGKSLVIAELAKIAQGRVLALAHVKELVEQNHQKYTSYGLSAGIYSAGLGRKDFEEKAIFGSVQSVANAEDSFFEGFSLLVIDECHRVAQETDGDTQYLQVINKLKAKNKDLCVLGLTATPYRLGLGWIYEYSHSGELRSDKPRFFKHCVYELPLTYMIENNYLTTPVKVDTPVTSYDFSELTEKNRMYTMAEVEELLKEQKRLTPLIIKNIVDITERYERKGVMIFSSTIRHAKEILSYLPEDDARLVIGDTDAKDRDSIIQDFKDRKFKYLVNVSVLTTGFDAPHVDVVAILRPTESVSLYQQIIGRGLRLDPEKKDCIILDYTGMGHNIYAPQIRERRPTKESVEVKIPCPQCGHENVFWGKVNVEGEVLEHFGRKCKGAALDLDTMKPVPCGYRFRFKICHQCGEQNDLTATECESCNSELIDGDSKVKQAKLSKKMHILRPEHIEFLERQDKNGRPFLEIKYYDCDAESVSEFHFLNNPSDFKRFNINFLRFHMKRPELEVEVSKVEEVLRLRPLLRNPSFVIARKQDKFWKVTEKIFSEELSSRYIKPF
ncbi:MAG: ATP-dependent helicase [Halobacteriovoraceae bacterium]|nr:ATP-dependent helicase [Halobacteriovoraceae bacterium]|tara:strand:+ start:117676 stop:119442 length:1767 start_codon:yes stop_codon:yes gene_type:complete